MRRAPFWAIWTSTDSLPSSIHEAWYSGRTAFCMSQRCLDPTDPHFSPTTGYILRFNASSKAFVDVFASDSTDPDFLHRPEGLAFDSAGNLWVTSFRANTCDSDKILRLDGKSGALLDKLMLWTPPAPRALAQAIIFGPGGNLNIPITGGDITTSGQVRRCDATTTPCDLIVQANSAGGALQHPWFLIFRKSDAATLNYGDED